MELEFTKAFLIIKKSVPLGGYSRQCDLFFSFVFFCFVFFLFFEGANISQGLHF